MTAAPAQPTDRLATPSLLRRLAAFIYEGMLLFAVAMLATYLYSALTQQRHALQGQAGLQAFLFVVLAVYFVWFWSRGGQTVAMRAWHLRLVTTDGGAISQGRAMLRYLASWIWFTPAWLTAWLADMHSPLQISALMAAGVVVYALLTFLNPQRQFWHDALCGTRITVWKPPPRRAQSDA